MAEPKIYTRNYVDALATISASHSSSQIPYLYDGDKDSKWISSGANSDATAVTITVEFQSGGADETRTIDTIFLINHNLEDPVFEYWTGSAWASLVSGSALTSANTKLTFNSVATSKIRLTNSTTQIADAEKFIGQLIACALTLDVGTDMDSYEVNYRQKAAEIELADGSLRRTVFRHTQNRSANYEARVRFRYLTTTQLASFRSIKEGGETFLWQPEHDYRPDELFHVAWVGAFRYRYSSAYKGGGFDLDLELREQ